MRIERKTSGAHHTTTGEMKRIIKEQEIIFQKKINQVDDSKTETVTDRAGNVTEVYYDKNGNELYSRTEDSGIHYQTYGYTDQNGSTVRFIDHDHDGNMDEFGYDEYTGKSNNPTMFQAIDKDDDGTFDIGMPCTGKDAGKHFDIKN
jgi:YD repeat-containing protein